MGTPSDSQRTIGGHDARHRVTKMEAERDLDKQDLPSQCL
jgi:hypothetical protein